MLAVLPQLFLYVLPLHGRVRGIVLADGINSEARHLWGRRAARMAMRAGESKTMAEKVTSGKLKRVRDRWFKSLELHDIEES